MQAHCLHGQTSRLGIKRSLRGAQRLAVPRAFRARSTIVCQSQYQTGARQVEATADDVDPSPFFEPLLRSFVLGVGAGIVCESAHVMFKFLGLAAQVGTSEVIDALPNAVDQFSPLFVWDHVAAVGSWVLLYTIEAIAILSVLKRYPDDLQKAHRTISSMATLPKMMLPFKLSALKHALYKMVSPAAARLGGPAIAGALPAAGARSAPQSSADATASSSAAPLAFRDSPTLTEELEEIAAQASAPLPTLPPLRQPQRRGPSGPPPPEDDEDEAQQRRKEQRQRREAKAEVEARRRAELQAQRASRTLKPGAWDPTASPYSRRQKELLGRKSYLRNFWYAAALSQNLKDGEPLGVDILGGRVVLFRDADTGEVQCLDDACPHRGAPLSGGWLAKAAPGVGKVPLASCDDDDECGDAKKGAAAGVDAHAAAHAAGGKTCVVCPYHGWAFDGEGRLQDVPSAEPGRWPKRPLVNKYPVVEQGGFVWLFYGDARLPAEERPPIPTTPEFDDPSWKPVYGEMEFECGHWGVFENAIDMAHIHYLHADSFGNKDAPRIADMQATRDTFHIESSFSIHNKPVSKLWEWTAVESVPVKAKAMLPSSSAITIQLGGGVSMITFVNTVPISETRCVNRYALIRNFAGWDGFDGWARRAMVKILSEDKVMVERLAPERLDKEYSLGPDAPQVAFRQLRQEWMDLGYGVPPESVQPRRGLLPGEGDH